MGLRRGRDSVRLYIIYRDIESVHACLAPNAHPLSPLSTAPGVSTCKLGFDPNHNPGSRSWGGGHAYCCKQRKGQWAVPPPCPSSPLPMFCPWKRVMGVPPMLQCSLWGILSLRGTMREGTRGQRKVPGGRES